ncbi:hypothetical protein POM88_010233 [Heracleum sosnowskyi]|uniref:Histone-lysine N-methyltransferase n=1 Tax=Heracleum sosnowskyi TaxID=360622 RepID=A0AAD8J9F5_9APIA|nr:hypothetical protein POM88_010233 [Heracleum sosnowskyi]
MSSNSSREKKLHKLPRKHSLEHGGREPPNCLRSFKRHKVSATPQVPTTMGAIAGEYYGTCDAGVTTVEAAFENLNAGGPSNLPVEISPIELESMSMKPHADNAELFKKVNHSEWKFNQEAGGYTISTASSPQSNSLQANSSSKMTCNNNGVQSWVESNEDDGKSVGQQGVKTYDFAAATGATDGYCDKSFEVLGQEGSYYPLLKHNDTKSNDGETATRKGVKTLIWETAACATDGCSDKVYELMGHKGSYYLLVKHDDAMSNDGTSAAPESQEGVKASYFTEATVATDGCSDDIYELMGHEGSYYLLLKHHDANFHVHNVEADVHNVEPETDWKHNSNLSGKPSINFNVRSDQEALCRSKVQDVFNLFQKTLKEQLLKNQATRKSKAENKTISSDVYEEVAMLLKQQKKWIYMNKQVLGAIPGVEVGDQFQDRAELVIVGVHAQFVASIDYMEKDGKKIATSILSPHFYSNDEELTDVIYFREGGVQTMAKQNLNDQTLVRGNLALKNSMDEETPVRVIRGNQSLEGKSTSFTYDGLFTVNNFWQEKAQNGEWVYMFQLNKMQGEPKLKVNKLGRCGKSKALYYRTLIDDISYGNEKIAIPVVNDIDNSKPPAFKYITKMVYPQLKKSANVRGCRCIDGCSDLVRCSCVVKNDGMVPFNENGALTKAKETIVYECGPSCKCPPSCMNRVGQHGLKIQLEVFKTETRGWGIRSRNFISSGSFICEYVGELLEDKQAEERIGFDEYLFDIGDEDGYAIDAAKIGNIGRFVNHSCSPNLYAQNVLFDHDDKMMPHVMLFATRKIYPLQELTYNYNYKIGHISDSNGNVKTKKCHCGAQQIQGKVQKEPGIPPRSLGVDFVSPDSEKTMGDVEAGRKPVLKTS